MGEFFAHIREEDNGEKTYQTVFDHCKNTAKYAAEALECVSLDKAGYIAGLLHDAGKYKKEFQEYIINNKGSRGSINHTFSGCRLLLELFHGNDYRTFEDATSELLAYAVGAHHGLFDCIDENSKSGFLHRMNKEDIFYEESKNNFLKFCANEKELKIYFDEANEQLKSVYQKLINLSKANNDENMVEFSFYLGLLARLLSSAVIEGDRRDTALFMNNRDNKEYACGSDFWEKYLVRMEKKCEEFPKNTPLMKTRSMISDICKESAFKKGDVYRLNIPTGGGKTLSSLRYALAHAAKWEKRRIIYTMPLLAILEQNAGVIREFLKDDDIILEHHSDVILAEEKEEILDERELAIENWHSPIIITTLVQLLNTMFSGKTASVRRFQALCDSIVVIDEVQTVPHHMLSIFNLTVNFLSKVCGTTFVLCSATQPCLEKVEHPLLLNNDIDIVPYDEKLWETFKRTDIKNAGPIRLGDIPLWLKEKFDEADNLLVVCNKKSESEFLYREMKQYITKCFHVSASMCMAHRKDVLKEMEEALERKEKLICISTQVMEAGIDVSFQQVVRLAAGMDNVIQAAGRCNRNGENKIESVYIIQCIDENLSMLKEIQKAKGVSVSLLNEFEKNPEAFDNDLASNKSIEWYYKKLFKEEGTSKDFHDYYLDKNRCSMLNMLSLNTHYYDMEIMNDGFGLHQSFKTAGKQFKVFDDNTYTIVVPYKGAEEIIRELENCDENDFQNLKRITTKVKPYTISIYQYQKEQLQNNIRCINGVMILDSTKYDNEIGLTIKKEMDFLEV